MSSPCCNVEPVSDLLFRVVPNQPHSRPTERAVIFVHGFMGDPQETWQQKDAPDSFPALLATD
ncbi:MAG: hypothetical protein ABSE87_15820, partial [Terracidiphilus sp.]